MEMELKFRIKDDYICTKCSFPKELCICEKLEAETRNINMDTSKKESEVIKNLADAESKEIGPQLEVYKKEADAIIAKGEANDNNERRKQETPSNAQGDTGVEGPPADQEAAQTPTGEVAGIGQTGTADMRADM